MTDEQHYTLKFDSMEEDSDNGKDDFFVWRYRFEYQTPHNPECMLELRKMVILDAPHPPCVFDSFELCPSEDHLHVSELARVLSQNEEMLQKIVGTVPESLAKRLQEEAEAEEYVEGYDPQMDEEMAYWGSLDRDN